MKENNILRIRHLLILVVWEVVEEYNTKARGQLNDIFSKDMYHLGTRF